MQKFVLFCSSCLIFFSSCSIATEKNVSSTADSLLSNKTQTADLAIQKSWIDTLFQRQTNKLIVFVKLPGQAVPVEINNAQFPGSVETTFNILKDSAGSIISISEFPFSESGDWHIGYSHYFDNDGKTFAFERQTNFFNSLCTPGVAYETKTIFYNDSFQELSSSYDLVDDKKQPLAKDSCQFPYNLEFKVSATLREYLERNKIPL